MKSFAQPCVGLSGKNAPVGSRRLAVAVHDPDAPTASGCWHRVVFNIPADLRSLPRGVPNPASGQTPTARCSQRPISASPVAAVAGRQTDKPHRYVFTVYTLEVDKLHADHNLTAAQVGFMINRIGNAGFTAACELK